MNRLRRIEGQVRGLQRMLDEDAWCPDILTQASAVNSALNSFCKTLLASHLRTCVTDDIRAGHDETVDELMDTLQWDELRGLPGQGGKGSIRCTGSNFLRSEPADEFHGCGRSGFFL